MAQLDGGGGGSDTTDTTDSTDTDTTTSTSTTTSSFDPADHLDGGADEPAPSPDPTPEDTETVDTGGADDPQVTTGTPGQTGVAPPETDDISQPAEQPDQGEPVDTGDEPDVARDLAQQFEDQLGRDVSPEQVDIRRVETADGTRFVGRPSGQLRAAVSRERAREAGFGPSAQAALQRDIAELRGRGPGLESGGREVGTDVIREAEREAVAELRQEAERAAGARLSGAAAAASAQGNRQRQLEQQTGGLTSFVEDVEDTLGFDPIPGEGPVVDADAMDQDFGQFGGQLGRDVESALQGLQTDIFEATELGEPGAFAEQFGPEAEAAVAESRAEGFTRAERQRQAFAGGAAQGIARTPAFLVGGGLLAKNALDLGADVGDEIARGDAEALQATAEGLGAATATTGSLAASQAIEEPYQTAGAAAGSLIGTGALFGAAGAVGRAPGLATRLAIQPGEEILGFGGNRLTRAVAGERRAQQLFPNNEPLIFSEEAAIRAGRRASDRARQQLGFDAEPAAGPTGLGFRSAEVETGEFQTTAAAETESFLDRLQQEFTGEDRGQVSMGLPASRRSGATEPEITQEDIASPRARGAPGGPETGRGTSARETFRQNVERRQRRRRERQRRSQEPSFDTEAEARQRIESALGFSGLGFDESGLTEVEVGQSPMEQLDQRVEQFTDTRLDTDLDQRQETRTDTETRQEFRTETETETELTSETARELERELALETRQETRREVETALFGDPDERRSSGDFFGFGERSAVFESGIEDVTQEDLEAFFGGDDRPGRDPFEESAGEGDDLAEEFDRLYYGDNQ